MLKGLVAHMKLKRAMLRPLLIEIQPNQFNLSSSRLAVWQPELAVEVANGIYIARIVLEFWTPASSSTASY
ncbi:unnamed protein product [Nezara viridula]|uniref:Uncharacterized protein n=1 Tax=Nezara viridula TaxID=85310 RepID=A0A9P0H137_NEZVI|nr:unnamed protein product [Nezara viridula]